MDDDDDIVEEIPVFLSKNLQDHLYLFQYPTKRIINLDRATVVNCCVKPVNKEVKIDFALDTDSAFYDRFKGEKFAVAADGNSQGKSDRPTFNRGLMDKQTFVSSKSIDDTNKYIIGIYQDKEIHLSPLTSILQLRPKFSHFDKDDKRKRAEEKAINEEDDDEEELQQVTVKFARTGTANSKKAKEKGYDNFVKKSGEEPWCETYWHARTSPTAELERQKLFATNQQISSALALESRKYVEKLLPSTDKGNSIDTVLPSNVISKAKLKVMSLSDQLKVILKDAKILTFYHILNLLHENVDPKLTADKVLRTLPLVAVLIQGNWVPQSQFLYPADTLSNANGVSSELMVRARDYILFRFSRNSSLYRRQVIAATQLPPAEVHEVLLSVARLNLEKKWELMLPPDKNFELRHPDLVQRQEMIWRATEQTYIDMESEKLPKRIRKRSVRDSKHQHSANGFA